MEQEIAVPIHGLPWDITCRLAVKALILNRSLNDIFVQAIHEGIAKRQSGN